MTCTPGYESHLILKGHGHSKNTLDVSRVELMRVLSYLDDDILSSIFFPISKSQKVGLPNKIDNLLSTNLRKHRIRNIAHVVVTELSSNTFTSEEMPCARLVKYLDEVYHSLNPYKVIIISNGISLKI